ncbi:MAG: GtrA family protein [Prevotella sp.]|nr:GtrA family protein [Candidatus Prevotella equi]
MLKDKINAVKNGDEGKAQFVRFILNGCLAAGIHYGVYFLLQLFLEVNLSYAIGYMVSFLVNFYFTCHFTFRTQPSWQHFIGFSGSHGVNFLLHIVLFWCCMQLGVHRLVAPVIVMGIAMLVQFTILRFVFKKH